MLKEIGRSYIIKSDQSVNMEEKLFNVLHGEIEN